MTYAEAKAKRDTIEARLKAASAAMPRCEKTAMGLTPDAVKFSPEYRAAKLVYDRAFAQLREFNATFVRRFRKEIKAEIDARRNAR